MRSLLLAATIFASLAFPAYAHAPQRSGDLDGDPNIEEVVVVQTRTPEPTFHRHQVRVHDRCPGGVSIDERISTNQDYFSSLRLLYADTERGKDIWLELRSGASARGGEARLVSWRATHARVCRKPRQLFRYSPPFKTPAGTTGFSNWSAEVKEVTGRYRGREVVLEETFTRGDEALCCPSYFRTRWFRYDAGQDQYVQYRSRVTTRRGA